MLVLRAFPHLAEARMVSILLATPCVTAGCLDVAIRKRADPNVSPGGRDRECPYPLQRIRLDESRAVGSCVAESRPGLLPPNTGPFDGHISQARRFGGIPPAYDR